MTIGKRYTFGGQAAKDAFELDTAANLALAQRYRDTEVKAGKRLVFKVAHFKTGKQLAQAVAAAKATPSTPQKP